MSKPGHKQVWVTRPEVVAMRTENAQLTERLSEARAALADSRGPSEATAKVLEMAAVALKAEKTKLAARVAELERENVKLEEQCEASGEIIDEDSNRMLQLQTENAKLLAAVVEIRKTGGCLLEFMADEFGNSRGDDWENTEASDVADAFDAALEGLARWRK